MALKRDRPGHFLRAWRKSAGLTLEQVAEQVHMSHQNLGKIERGEVPYQQGLLELLADIYQIEVASLIMRDPGRKDIYSLAEDVRTLPASAQREVADFVAFVKQRQGRG